MATTLIGLRYAIDERTFNGTLLANDTNPTHRPGVHRRDGWGREYVYVQTRDALTVGQPVRQSVTGVSANNSVIVNLGAGYAAGYTGTVAFDTAGSQLPTVAASSMAGWYATVNFDQAAWGDTYRILGNTSLSATAGTMQFDRAIDTALVDNDVIAIWSTFVVELAGGSNTYASNQAVADGINDSVGGIALTTVSANSYTWVQVKGLSPTCIVRSKATGFSFNPYAYDSTTYFPPFVVAGGTAGTMEGVLMTGVQSGAAATNIEITQLAQGTNCRSVVPLVTQTAATQPAPLILDFNILGD